MLVGASTLKLQKVNNFQLNVKGDFKKKWILGQMRDPRCILEEKIDNPLAEVNPLEDIPYLEDIPFYSKQVKIALRNCGYIDPDSIEEYIAKRGYQAFIQTLHEIDPGDIIGIIKDAGLGVAGAADFQPESNGRHAPNRKECDTLSATQMRATRAPIWTEAFWKAILIASLRGC